MPPRATKPVTPELCCVSRVGDRQVTGLPIRSGLSAPLIESRR